MAWIVDVILGRLKNGVITDLVGYTICHSQYKARDDISIWSSSIYWGSFIWILKQES